LGRRLLFGVKDLMASGEALPKVMRNSNVKEVLHEMTRGMMGAVLVLDEQQKLWGLITDSDIRRVLEQHEDFFELEASDVMNDSPSFCKSNDNAYEVLLSMRTRSKPITLMPVLDDQDQACGVLRLETMVQQGLV
jgi:arabinose-5-phosphate isomerase